MHGRSQLWREVAAAGMLGSPLGAWTMIDYALGHD